MVTVILKKKVNKIIWYLHTLQCYSALQKKEILPLATICMSLEAIRLSEINRTQKDKYYTTPFI